MSRARTSVEIHRYQGGHLAIKRDDLFTTHGMRGGKARACAALIAQALAAHRPGVTTAGSRSSPQVHIVAVLARANGLACRVHTPAGTPGPEVAAAVTAGADHVPHRAGYNSVIIARAKADAEARGWAYIPFGMECLEAVAQTAAQVPPRLPPNTRRIVVPVGSGMSLAGILHGTAAHKIRTPLLGVCVGADPTRRLDRWAPPSWRCLVTLARSEGPYDRPAPPQHRMICGTPLDPIYEAKAVPYLRPGDLFWIVGLRATALRE